MVGRGLGSTLVALSVGLVARVAHTVKDRARIEHIFATAIRAVQGERILQQGLRWEHGRAGERVLVFERDGQVVRLPGSASRGQWRVIAIGKASISMARGALRALGELGSRLDQGLVIAKENADFGAMPRVGWQLIEGGHPFADERSLRAGEALLRFVSGSRPEDRYLVLLSGGASALAVQPVPGISLADKSACVQALMAQGAPIAALNLLRRHLSMIKGGGLARAIAPARHLTLAISDVPGDDPAIIGSAPTLDVPRDPVAVEAMLKEFNLWQAWQPLLAPLLQADRAMQAPPPYAVVATLDDAIEAARVAAIEAQLEPWVLGRVFYGDLSLHVEQFCEAIRRCVAEGSPTGALLIAAGEPTLRLAGADPHAGASAGAGASVGRGGRAQHFALCCARALQGIPGVSVLAAGSDGTDGPTPVAGAVIDGGSWSAMQRAGVDPERALRDYDSYTALHAIGAHVYTGETGTNVADLFMAVVHSG